jgi:hypothetical protein
MLQSRKSRWSVSVFFNRSYQRYIQQQAQVLLGCGVHVIGDFGNVCRQYS